LLRERISERKQNWEKQFFSRVEKESPATLQQQQQQQQQQQLWTIMKLTNDG